MEHEHTSPFLMLPAQFFEREMERCRELPPQFVHVDSYMNACLTQWKNLYPTSDCVDAEARQLGEAVLREALRQMSEVVEAAQNEFAEAEKSPQECQEYYYFIGAVLDRSGVLVEWDNEILHTDCVSLYVDKWKAMQQEVIAVLELQNERLNLEAYYADNEVSYWSWHFSLCYFMPILLFGALLLFFMRFVGANIPAGTKGFWTMWASLHPVMESWVLVPSVLLFGIAMIYLVGGLKQLFAAEQPSLSSGLILWAPLLILYIWPSVEQWLPIERGLFESEKVTVTWSMVFQAVGSIVGFVVLPFVGTIVLSTHGWKTIKEFLRE